MILGIERKSKRNDEEVVNVDPRDNVELVKRATNTTETETNETNKIDSDTAALASGGSNSTSNLLYNENIKSHLFK